MSALYSFIAVIVVLIAYCAGYIRGQRHNRIELDSVDESPNMTVLSAKKGDTIVVSYPGVLTKVQRENVLDQLDEAFPDGIKVIVLDSAATATLSGYDRRWPLGSTEPVRWDDTQPGSEA